MRRLPRASPIITAAEMRRVEQAAFDSGISQDMLMERAGTAIARETARLSAGRPVLVLAGPGNNGGDAYIAARLLAAAGQEVAVAAMGTPREGAAARMAARWSGRTTSLSDAPRYPVVLDGLLGTGPVRPFDQATTALMDDVMASACLRIAIDLPSTVDADTGQGALGADVTIALGALKPGNLLADGMNGGHVLLADIGVPVTSHWRTIGAPAIAPVRRDATKFSRGMVVVVAGAMPGAAWLASTAALHGGAGYVVLAGLDPPDGAPHALIRKRLTHVRDLAHVLDDDRIGAVIVGPGLGRDDTATALLDIVLASNQNLVIDGDALTLLGRDIAQRVDTAHRTVCLTPHAGEFARMFDTAGSKIVHTVAAARSTGATVVHKGPDTVIAHPDGTAIVAAGATPWLATAGSGDVLAGLVAARLSGEDSPSHAVENAVWLHTRAATLGGCAFTADDLARTVQMALTQALSGGG